MNPTIFRVGPTDRLIRALTHLPLIKRQAPHIASWLRDPERARRKEFEIKFHGFRYRGEINCRIDWCIYFLKDYLAPEVDLIKRTAETVRRHRDRFVCYDIGANIGHMTLAMASVADEVLAFEPSPYALSRLREKLLVNHLSNVAYLELALGEKDADVQFDIFSCVDFQARRVNSGPLTQTFGKFDAKVRRGDDLIAARNLVRPSFIRINAADDYLDVLEGLADTLRGDTPIILIEVPAGYHRALDERSLRSVLYPNADLYVLRGAFETARAVLDPFDPSAHRVVCLPDSVT